MYKHSSYAQRHLSFYPTISQRLFVLLIGRLGVYKSAGRKRP